ncbi:MAG: DegT/DnrJ/EryC1/StrS family aminotransferase [Deltaproteobacteria bacterium]|nr:DegT/DnrJ/EryC1/StrS family aminotransferase [Deltaproteobacteria bacterium]
MIQMVDLKRQYHILKEEIDAAVQEVLEGTHFILGPNVSQLEKEIASYHGVDDAVGVGNGTDALLLALRACGIGEGDEVITTPFTFIATAEVIALLKAVPVFIDIDHATYNMDPAAIEEKISPRTKAIIPVHLFGHPVDMDAVMDIAARKDLKVIEDCAQAFGAEYKGKKVGTFGDCGCFSFFPSKNLACYGDGGMVIARDGNAGEMVRMLRNHGSRVKYYHAVLGYNSRLDELQAAVLRVKFRHIDEFNAARRKNAALYSAGLTGNSVVPPVELPGCTHVYHQYTIRTGDRDTLMDQLKQAGIASAVYYPLPLHRQEVFLAGDVSVSCPVSDECASKVLSLPMFPELTEEEIGRVCEVINNAP